MADLSSSTPLPNPVSIIGPHFCSSEPIDLAVVGKVFTITDGNFVVSDKDGNIVFKVKGAVFTIHGHRVLLDANENPIVTIRKKLMTAHNRWQVFKGDSTESSDLIFSAKRSTMIQLKTKLDVFLANNTEEEACDFKVKGSWWKKSCVIYAGDGESSTSTIVAQMKKESTIVSSLIGKDKYMVTVNPNIDYAFIVALIVILDGINADANRHKKLLFKPVKAYVGQLN